MRTVITMFTMLLRNISSMATSMIQGNSAHSRPCEPPVRIAKKPTASTTFRNQAVQIASFSLHMRVVPSSLGEK